MKTFCAIDSCKAFTCIDRHKVKVCIKNDLGKGKKDDEEAPGSRMLRVPPPFLPDSVEVCLPSISAEALISFGYADCGSCEPV